MSYPSLPCSFFLPNLLLPALPSPILPFPSLPSPILNFHSLLSPYSSLPCSSPKLAFLLFFPSCSFIPNISSLSFSFFLKPFYSCSSFLYSTLSSLILQFPALPSPVSLFPHLILQLSFFSLPFLPYLNMFPSTGSIQVFMILLWFSINFLYGFPATWTLNIVSSYLNIKYSFQLPKH